MESERKPSMESLLPTSISWTVFPDEIYTFRMWPSREALEFSLNYGTTRSARDSPDPDSQAPIRAGSRLPISEDRNSALPGA